MAEIKKYFANKHEKMSLTQKEKNTANFENATMHDGKHRLAYVHRFWEKKEEAINECHQKH